MKKTISILLIVAMMLASILAVLPVSAADPEGTAISNEEEFLAMKPDGEYYLANDIVLNDSYVEFKGTLNGNGKTITVVNAPAFKTLTNAFITDLNVKATYTKLRLAKNGALANVASGYFSRINVDVACELSAEFVQTFGGMFGSTTGDTQILHSAVSGYINAPVTDNAGGAVGGFVGEHTGGTLTVKYSTGSVDISVCTASMSIGGIVGVVTTKAEFEECLNYGNLAGASRGNVSGDIQHGAGGILGEWRKGSNLNIKNCRNFGNITGIAPEGATKDYNLQMGGILGRIISAKDMVIDGCINSGKISGGHVKTWHVAGGIVGMALTYNYDWAPIKEFTHTVKNCVNLGEVGGTHYDGGIVATYFQINSPLCVLNIENCANYADILSTANYSAGIFNSTSQGGELTLNIKNCYNEGKTFGKYAGGIVCYYNGKVDTTYAADKEIIKEHATVIIENCINAGEAMYNEEVMFGMMNTFTCDGEILKVINSGSTVEGQALVRPDKADIEVSGEAIALDELMKLVPANTSDLDKLVAENRDNDPTDFTAGWTAFEDAMLLADLTANKPATAEDVQLAIDELTKAVKGLVAKTNITKTELEAALTAAAAFNGKQEEYTVISWLLFSKALEQANAAKESDRQSVINKAATALNAAIEGLAIKANFDALDEEIAKYTDLVQEEYTTASWTAFAEALAVAQATRENENATGDMVQSALDALSSAAEALAKKVDIAPLQAKVDDVKTNYDRDAYTAISYGDLQKVLSAANAAIEANDSGEADIANLIADLDAAIEGLKKKANFVELDKLVASVAELKESDYTATSWTAVTEALEEVEKAKNPNTIVNVSEEKEATLIAALNAAIEALVRLADYTEIDTFIAELKELKAEDYSQDSWQALQNAIAAANKLKANKGATEIDAKNALDALKAAKDGLKEPVVETEAPTAAPTEAPGATEEPKDQGGCGGFFAASTAVIAIVSVLGCAITLKKKD